MKGLDLVASTGHFTFKVVKAKVVLMYFRTPVGEKEMSTV